LNLSQDKKKAYQSIEDDQAIKSALNSYSALGKQQDNKTTHFFCNGEYK